MTALRPIPADFAAKNAELRNRDKLARHYKASRKTIFRWRQELGIAPSPATPLTARPADFEQRAEVMNGKQLVEHYRFSHHLITRWLKEIGKGGHKGPQRLAPPADLAERCKHMTTSDLARFYGVTHKIAARWLSESGLFARGFNPTSAIRTLVHTDRLNSVKVRDAAEEAAYKLQRLRPVYRCTETGKADVTGKFWRVGNVVMTDAELIARAEKVAA